MKIALSFPGCHRRAGVERVVYECSRFLAGRGHEVTVIASEWDAHPGIRYRHVPPRNHPFFLTGPSYFARSARAIRGGEFDVLNTHGCICPFDGVQWVQSVHLAWMNRC